jgi:hypothetical protein
MSIRFAIKNTASKAEKEGDVFIRYSGTAEPFRRVSDREANKIGIDANGDSKLAFTTGLDTEKVKFFKWYNEDEQEQLAKAIEDLRPGIIQFYGGVDIVNPHNRFFWGENRDVARLSLSHDDIDVFYDTKSPVHALLYLSIASGAFIDLVAPTKDWAERYQLPHYMVLETEDNYEDEDEITRSDAHAALGELRKEESAEALFILAWCIQYDTNGFGGYLRSTPTRDLINYHIKYIDGKISLKKKRETPKVFLEYVEKWKGQQTRPALYAEAYIKAGEWYALINKREKKYTTADGTALGNTIDEAVSNIMKKQNNAELETLRDKVEAKWKE